MSQRRKEIDWLLSVTDYIVEFVPGQEKLKDGTNMESFHFYFKIQHNNTPVLTDNGYSTKKRSAHEHPCSMQLNLLLHKSSR